MIMDFEYDIKKNQANKLKHGIDFNEADSERLEIPAKVTGEPRYLVIGKIRGKHWSAVVTYRSSNVRLISVRRSRAEEVELYEYENI
jgi:uncharacterized DUF497 family protein